MVLASRFRRQWPAGVAVICSDSVGAKDLVRDNVDGFVIPSRDTEKLKEKILYLYENPDICLSMGRSARGKYS